MLEIWNKFPYFLLVIAVFLWRHIDDKPLVTIYIIFFCITYFMNNYEKRRIREPRPGITGPFPENPGILETEKYFGNPSGHTCLMIFSIIYLTLYMIHENSFSIEFLVIMMSFALFIGYSRIIQQYHTFDQVLEGGKYGTIMGILAFFIYHMNR